MRIGIPGYCVREHGHGRTDTELHHNELADVDDLESKLAAFTAACSRSSQTKSGPAGACFAFNACGTGRVADEFR